MMKTAASAVKTPDLPARKSGPGGPVLSVSSFRSAAVICRLDMLEALWHGAPAFPGPAFLGIAAVAQG
ncbi:MAG: hypothetical protein OEY85_04930 [Rhodospirillales bacterium]|nr:hypothetical protein [Rhodospirillales bacterium]